mgnify:FL=1
MGRPLLSGMDVLVPNITLLGSHSTFAIVETVPDRAVVVGLDTEFRILSQEEAEKYGEKKVRAGKKSRKLNGDVR